MSNVNWWWLFLLAEHCYYYGNACRDGHTFTSCFLLLFIVWCVLWLADPSSSLMIHVGNEETSFFRQKRMKSTMKLNRLNGICRRAQCVRVWQSPAFVGNVHSFERRQSMRWKNNRKRKMSVKTYFTQRRLLPINYSRFLSSWNCCATATRCHLHSEIKGKTDDMQMQCAHAVSQRGEFDLIKLH